MSDNLEHALHNSVDEMRQKYAHFLLAAVGACIGFAITQSGKSSLTIWAAPLGAALAFWSASFYIGCRYLHFRSTTLATNAEIVRLLNGQHEMAGNNPTAQKIGYEVLKDGHQKTDAQAGWCYRWQLRTFVIGTIFFIGWHVLEMWRRNPENLCLWV